VVGDLRPTGRILRVTARLRLIVAAHILTSELIEICGNVQGRLVAKLLLLVQGNLMIELLQKHLGVIQDAPLVLGLILLGRFSFIIIGSTY